MQIRELFLSDVTRDIPPVVYFHEQSPQKLADEVREYIITGGWPRDHPNHTRVSDGIHEQYVRLLRGITSELAKPGGPELPTAWISGFYGSGKSSFAKLFGLALDNVKLPSGQSLSEAFLERDTSPLKDELREAWNTLRNSIQPLSVVFDVGSVARDNEHIHAVAVRQVQRRLGYCSTEPLVADFELNLERDGEWARFLATAQETLGKPWDEIKDKALAEEEFSFVMSIMFPERYTDPMAWFISRAGTHARSESPEEAVQAIHDMLRFRRPESTLFLVVDEVSQYVLANKDRVDRLRAFATALGAGLRGRAWLLALGQQKLDEEADESFLVWAKDRFPPKLRVHLSPTNIRDVVHKRLLQKKAEHESTLKDLFQQHRADLKLFAYGCESITPDDFVEVYPMLPGHIDLLLQITSALRTRSSRAQGDDQAIRGLLQLLGELFRSQNLADMPVGALVTFDQIYDVQHSALDSDVQASMARVLSQCASEADALLVRAAKVVALLELIQDTLPTDASLVAQCLYKRVDLGNRVSEVTEALETLKRRNLLGYSEKHGYKIQSSAGEEWDRERRDLPIPRERLSEIVQGSVKYLLATPDRPRLQGRPFPWAGVFSDGRRADDATILDPRDEGVVRVDFRYLVVDERGESTWVKRSTEAAFETRLVWVSGDIDQAEHLARELARSQAMVAKYKPRRESLNAARKMLLQQEDNRVEDLEARVREEVASMWMGGRMYFRGRAFSPEDLGASFAVSLNAAGHRILPDLYPHFTPTQVQPAELQQLIAKELSGPSEKFMNADLGLLELDSGRYVPACSGVVPKRVQEYIDNEVGVSGSSLILEFSGPPYGYTANVVKACVAGLLRAGKVRIQPEGGSEITAVRDVGVQDLFKKDRDFRRSTCFPAGDDDIGARGRAKICKFFLKHLEHEMDREDHAIADAVASYFPQQANRLRDVLGRIEQLPGAEAPDVLDRLGTVFEQCIRSCRQTKPTVKLVKKHLDTLNDGMQQLRLLDAELTPSAKQALKEASTTLKRVEQLRSMDALNHPREAEQVEEHLASRSPWRDTSSIADAVSTLDQAYSGERQRLMAWQESMAEQSRASVKSRAHFETLTNDQRHKVLRPLALAITNTTVEALHPPLDALRDAFLVALRRAEDQANERFDDFFVVVDENENDSDDDAPQPPPIRPFKYLQRLRNRELNDEKDVEALVDELRTQLLEQVRKGTRIRLT